MTVLMDRCFGLGSKAAGFAPRAPRIGLQIPVIFDFAAGRAWGESLDISDSGILAVFSQNLEVWLTGQLSILVGGRNITIDARVARVNGPTAALAFRGMSRENQRIIQNLIASTSEQLL
jgi:hypothetical protein